MPGGPVARQLVSSGPRWLARRASEHRTGAAPAAGVDVPGLVQPDSKKQADGPAAGGHLPLTTWPDPLHL